MIEKETTTSHSMKSCYKSGTSENRVSYYQKVLVISILFVLYCDITSTPRSYMVVTNQPPMKVCITGNDYLTIIGYRHSLRSLLRISL